MTYTFLTKHQAVEVLDAANVFGIVLDRLDVVGPRGGKQTLWRQASARTCQMAAWHETKKSAVAA